MLFPSHFAGLQNQEYEKNKFYKYKPMKTGDFKEFGVIVSKILNLPFDQNYR